MNPVWLVSLGAVRQDASIGDVVRMRADHGALLIPADTAGGAEAAALIVAIDRWPIADGWQGHDTSAARLLSDALNEVGAAVTLK